MPAATPALALEFLLVSGEAFTADTVGEALREIGGTATCAPSADVAREFLLTHKVDGVILDVDIKTALELISHMRRSKNARAFAFICVKNDAEEAVALKGGATATLMKPLSVAAVSARINSFKSIILTERRRYQRFDVTLPITIDLEENTYQGIVENISQGGMAVRLPCLLPESSIAEFALELQNGVALEGSVQLRWARPNGLTGMEFRTLPPRCKDELMNWLREQASAATVSECP